MNTEHSSNDEMVADMFAKARQAWELGDKRASSILINQILKHDITHPGAWELLYNQLGGGKPFEEFQLEFVQKYYPDRVSLLWPQPPPVPVQEPEVNPPAVPDAEPSTAMPVESEPAESTPVESERVESTPARSAPVESLPAERKPVEAKQAENELVESTPAGSERVESLLAEHKPVEAKLAESEPAESTPSGSAGVKYCSKCGKNRIADGDFCTYCGSPLQSTQDEVLTPPQPLVDAGAQGSMHASTTVSSVQNLVPAPRAASSGQAPAPAPERPTQLNTFVTFYQEHKGITVLIGAAAIVLLCLVAGVLLLKPLLGRSSGSSADLPEGLTTGMWLGEVGGGGGVVFAFSRENKGYFEGGPGTYKKTSANALDWCSSTLKDNQGETLCGTLTVTNIVNPQNVEVQLSFSNSNPENYTLKKRYDDTSSGNLKKDVIGTWVYDESLVDLIECDSPGVVCEIVFDKNQHVIDSQRGSLSYSIVGDKLTMFGEDFIVSNFGDFMFLTLENTGNNPRGFTLIRK